MAVINEQMEQKLPIPKEWLIRLQSVDISLSVEKIKGIPARRKQKRNMKVAAIKYAPIGLNLTWKSLSLLHDLEEMLSPF